MRATLQRTLRRRRSGRAPLMTIAIIVLLCIVGAVAIAWSRGRGGGTSSGSADIHQVVREGFDITIPASGELAPLKQTQIVNKLDNFKATITEIVEEGKFVRRGDLLVKLADEEIKLKLKDAEDEVNVTEKGLTAAEAKLAIQRNTAESEMSKADLAIELAQIALEAWEKGEMISERKKLDLALATAKIDLERLEAKFTESQKLLDEGFISKDEYELDRIALIEARAKVEQADLDIHVFQTYKVKEELAKKNSDLEQARAEKGRVQQKNDAEIVSATADVESSRYKHQSAKDRLAKLQEQLSYCTITAPEEGLVVYSSSMDGGNRWGGDDNIIKVGAQLYPNQTIIILPDTSQMTANIKVSESLSGRIKPGQSAMVRSDALPNVAIRGEVLGVSVLAEGGGWRDPNRRDYTVKILLVDAPAGLKPSMRCKGEIFVDRVDDVLSVPIQSVFRQGSVAYVYVPSGGGYAQKQVTIGRSSEMSIEVLDGLDEGDVVLLREPPTGEIVSKIEMPSEGRPGAGGGPGEPRGPGRDSARRGGKGAETPGGSPETKPEKAPAIAAGEGAEKAAGEDGAAPAGEVAAPAAPTVTPVVESTPVVEAAPAAR